MSVKKRVEVMVTDANFANFLEEVVDRMNVGFKLDKSYPPNADFFTGFNARMYLEEKVVTERPKLGVGPFSTEHLANVDFPELKEYCQTNYGITDRGRQQLVKKIIKFYEERGITDDLEYEEYRNRISDCGVSGQSN